MLSQCPAFDPKQTLAPTMPPSFFSKPSEVAHDAYKSGMATQMADRMRRTSRRSNLLADVSLIV